MAKFLLGSCCVVVLLSLGACATKSSEPDTVEELLEQQQLGGAVERIDLSATSESYSGSGILQGAENQYRQKVQVYPGTGRFLNPRAKQAIAPLQQIDGEVTLNFEAADIRDVVKVVFDTLQQNYTIDPRVQGEVTVQTSKPLPRDMLIPTLETLLRANGAALVRTGGLYKVVPTAAAIPGNTRPSLRSPRLGPGFSVRIFPLRYISALEMQKILEPFAPEGGILLVDPSRNLLILAGTEQELTSLQETIELFDVNWLKGMSVGFYILENVESQTLATELEGLFGTGSDLPMAGLFRFVPISRLNALLVITPQPEFLKEASVWVKRLDGSGGERLYIYEVQNGDAGYIATVLSEIFDAETASISGASNSGQVAPGLTPSQVSSGLSSSSGGLGGSSFYLGEGGYVNDIGGYPLVYQAAQEAPEEPAPAPSVGGGARGPTVLGGGAGSGIAGGIGGGESGNRVRIIPDVENNALLIWANEPTYDKIVNALRRLDITPRQVLIEATIAEVTLNGRLRYGMQWFFTNNNVGGRYTGIGSLSLAPGTVVDDVLGNVDRAFTYVLSKGDFVRAFLDLLATESKLRILSSPQIMVIDNQDAEIRVGFQQPVQSSTTISSGGNTVQSIQFKDTGVFLKVTPQVNSSGLVTMNIEQEVIDVGAIDQATGQRRFFQRKVTSKVAISSGQSIVLGGLISETKRDNEGGIPILYKIPLIGPLFGQTEETTDRTELLILITPRVVQSSLEAEQVTEELRRRMKSIDPFPLDRPFEIDPNRLTRPRRRG